MVERAKRLYVKLHHYATLAVRCHIRYDVQSGFGPLGPAPALNKAVLD